MRSIETAIDIDASPDAVWEVLTDLDAYSDWNPFAVEASGQVEEDAKLRVKLKPPGKRATVFKPKVTVVEAGAKFEWLGRLLIPGIFDGRHQFHLTSGDVGTHFVQREEFSGMLAGPILGKVGKGTEEGFHAMNRALKARVESST